MLSLNLNLQVDKVQEGKKQLRRTLDRLDARERRRNKMKERDRNEEE